MSEHDEQIALFEWAELAAGRWPELRYMFAVPSGGDRTAKAGKYMKDEGAKRGVPDICLPVARGGYHSLYIELKYGKNTPTKEQLNYLEFLHENGYAVAICYGFYIAKEVVEWYLQEPPTIVVPSENTVPMPNYWRH